MKIIILYLLVFHCTNSGHNYEAPAIIQLGEQTTQIRQLKSGNLNPRPHNYDLIIYLYIAYIIN